MLFYTVLQITLIIGLCHSRLSNSMDMPTRQNLIIPPIIQHNSEMLNMLAKRPQNGGILKLPNGTPILQTQIDGLAATYQPDFDPTKVSLDTLIETAQLHDHLQIALPPNILEMALCNKIETHQCDITQLSLLGPDWHSRLVIQFIKNTQLDTQLFKPQIDVISAQANIVSNSPKHTVEKLLFTTNTTKIYGAYDWADIPIKGTPRFKKLLVKNSQNEIEKSIAIFNRYSPLNIKIHPNCLYALAMHHEKDDYDRLIADLIDLKTGTIQSIIPDTLRAYHACCFNNNNIYVAYNKNETIIIESMDLESKQKTIINTIENKSQDKVIEIALDKNKNIIVATQKALFIIKNSNTQDIKITTHEMLTKYAKQIKKISLNNNGTHVCVVIRDNWQKYDHPCFIYLCDLTQKKITWMDTTKELKGNLRVQDEDRWKGYEQTFCLSDVNNISWNADDSLLLLECFYRYQYSHSGARASSGNIGHQYAFINPLTGNGWSENDIRYDYSLINLIDQKTIIIDRSLWKKQTKLLQWCHQDLSTALQYLDPQNHTLSYSPEEKLSGAILLHSILQQSNKLIELDESETGTYNKSIPNAMKRILAKTKTILLFEKEQNYINSQLRKIPHIVASTIQTLLAWSKNGAHFCYQNPKGFILLLVFLGYTGLHITSTDQNN